MGIVLQLRFDFEKRGSDRQDRDRNALGGQAPEGDRSLFQDLGVRREALQRDHVQRGKELRSVTIVGYEQVEECVDCLRERLRLLITVYYNNEGAARELV